MDEHDITKAVIDELTRECSALTAERDAALARAHAIEQEIFRNHPVGPVYVDVFQSIKLQREQTEAAERERDALRERALVVIDRHGEKYRATFAEDDGREFRVFDTGDTPIEAGLNLLRASYAIRAALKDAD